MNTRKINVTIDRVVLRGIDANLAPALTESLKKELIRTLAQPGSQTRLQNTHDAGLIKVGKVQLKAGRVGARQFGTGVGRAIAKGVGK
jgi:hypothetical protein